MKTETACGACLGSGWVPRDPDICTEQECPSCSGSDDDAALLTSEPPNAAVLEYQFLSDVITAAGLLRYGRQDKGLARRISEFAVDKMATLPIMPGPRVYISGPMSNYHDLNRDAFNAEAARLLALGYLVENPADVVLPDGATWADFMRADIPRLLACSHIRMLDGWTMSKGARLEHHIAISLGLEVLTDCDLQETPCTP